VDRSKGYGSSNTARRFFEHLSVFAAMLGLDEEKFNFIKFYVILHVMSSRYNVKIEKFQKYCLDTAEVCVENFP